MVFFIVTLVLMYAGRKIGWALSKRVLYTASPITAGTVSAIWGIGVAFVIFGLIQWQNPNIILKIIMGYLLGWYIAIPNFGLINESSIPDEEKSWHSMISVGPALAYITTMVTLSLLTPGI